MAPVCVACHLSLRTLTVFMILLLILMVYHVPGLPACRKLCCCGKCMACWCNWKPVCCSLLSLSLEIMGRHIVASSCGVPSSQLTLVWFLWSAWMGSASPFPTLGNHHNLGYLLRLKTPNGLNGYTNNNMSLLLMPGWRL